MAVGNNGTPSQAQREWSRFARLTAESYPDRLTPHEIPPFDLHAKIGEISKSQPPSLVRVIATKDTGLSNSNGRQNGGARGVPASAAELPQTRMPIHLLLAWTKVEGYLALGREVPIGMAVDLVLNGLQSEWRLVRGSWPRDEVLRGV